MIRAALLAARALALGVPGGGIAVAAFDALVSPAGRLALIAALAFWGGWEAKARIDEAATLRAVIAKTRVDLAAARDTAEAANAVVAELSSIDAKNQEIIRDLQLELSQRPAVNTCPLDDAAARSLRRLR
jgi:hypothetical protein